MRYLNKIIFINSAHIPMQHTEQPECERVAF